MPFAAADRTYRTEFFLTAGQEHLSEEEMKKSIPCDPHSGRNPMGASSLESNVPRAGLPVPVQTLDFAAWLMGLDLRKRDDVTLKIDIEASEFSLLHHLVHVQGFDVCVVDRFFVEWHPRLVKESDPERLAKIQFMNDFTKRKFTSKCNSTEISGWH